MLSSRVRIVRAMTTFILTACGCSAQCWSCGDALYDPSEGIPQSPCFFSSDSPVSTYVTGGALHLDSPNRAFFYNMSEVVPFLWSNGQVFDATIRVPVGGGTNDHIAGFRGAANLSASDTSHQTCGIIVWKSGVMFSTDKNFNPGAYTAVISFDGGSAFHTYSIVTAGSVNKFLIDGVVYATLPPGPADTVNSSYAGFGIDSRYSGPTQSEWQSVRFVKQSKPVIAVQPQSVETCFSNPAAFAVVAPAGGLPTYQWQWEMPDGTWVDVVEGANEYDSVPQFSASDPHAYDFGVCCYRPGLVTIPFRCVLTLSCGELTSDVATLTIKSADFNGDGFVDFFDFTDFATCFEGGECPPGTTADVNGDGLVDFFDFTDFVTVFETGC